MIGESGEGNGVQRLATALHSRLAGESRVARAQGFAWLCAGAGISLCLGGFGCALAFIGYSHMLAVRPAAEMTARALADAVQRARLKTIVSGRMSLSPESQLTLAAGQTV